MLTESPKCTNENVCEDIGEEQFLLKTPHSRMLGGTEYSWCKALGGGTGITVLALHFEQGVDPIQLQEVVHAVQRKYPRLRSKLVRINGNPAFSVCPHPYVEVEFVESATTSEILSQISSPNGSSPVNDDSSTDEISIDSDGYVSDTDCQDWQYLVEHELNINPWVESPDFQQPKDMLIAKLYHLPQDNSSLFILRIHTSICDRASAATILKEMLHAFYEKKFGHPPPQRASPSQTEGCDFNEEDLNFMAIEDAIPKGKANKPFWAHGIDLLGYSLGSRRHSYLPFEDPQSPRRSQVVRLCLSSEETTRLQNACEIEKTTISGALTAAGLKATAVLKDLGDQSENYAVTTLVDCRSLVDNNLPINVVGFYHSAIINTHSINEAANFWELARRCSNALETAVKNRKHFTDIGDVNFLMCQAIQYPSLTPSSSLRTSHIVVFEGPMIDDMGELEKAIGLKDYMGCSSIHGVGPSIAVFDTIRNGALDCACVYPAPLHSKKQMQTLISCMKSILVSVSKN
ncbi:uncharacterized protein LOC131068763 [Cryptomeria japonica]|uniref:uncharacterized protein LOC131068763 n=1 Tax=Cryptomeria japonica TaxID=3369 RepID=UPI0027D9F339|nr:uncharacterized protein LOC131068763 [Cryptomeria japonica]XP_057860012.2 uncharacterized protein LOC131068763 [Cryptomeria japonica]